MKKRDLWIGLVTSTVLLAGCGFLGNNEGDTQQSQTSNHNNNTENTQNQNAQNDQKMNNGPQQNNQTQKSNKGGDVYPKNTREYYAQVMLTSFGDYNQLPNASMTYTPVDMSGQSVFPYNPNASAHYPDGVVRLRTSGIAHVIFKDNNDGTITFYDNIPAKFQEAEWQDEDYSRQETERLLANGRTVPINTNLPKEDIDYVASLITQDGLTSYSGPVNSNTGSSSSSSSASSSLSSTKVTRSNVIDLVEDYEGHLLDTTKYTFKEPAQFPDGRWGFSILDKSGNLVGSYIIDTDGTVTKYDENGDPI
ncbi:hypothetical protein MUA48_00745 [Staphylococcus sp. IVB6238]|uniref:hypothetical protein n=1 Tax=Staphylococcus sp. IVB6238 TaxID=2989770 RepID=UPI0021CFD89C|nr:hypothetical protein [Staphylococcus sp. IVB6238]UXR74042.1 hypothetical protein MUA48_00745 [Staphylococcus sp. IVB6238]